MLHFCIGLALDIFGQGFVCSSHACLAFVDTSVVQVDIGLVEVVARGAAGFGCYRVCCIERADNNLAFFKEELYSSVVEACYAAQGKLFWGSALESKFAFLDR